MQNKNLIYLLPFTLIFLFVYPVICAESPLKPARLTCDNLVNPLGIDSGTPRLGWQFISTEKSQVQSAYEIVISDKAENINRAEGNVWKSGKVQSAQSVNVSKSVALKLFTKYYWRVRVYDGGDEASEWSEIASFETAMLNDDDWTAKWIGDGKKNPDNDEDYFKDDRMPLFRKEFPATKAIASARLYISGVGYYEAYLNGKKISDLVLDPGWTTYKKQVLYAVHDITSLLQKGQNVAGVMLGNGWWNPLPIKLFGRWDLRNYQQTERPCLKAEIRITYSDQSVDVIPTDGSWESAQGPIVRNNVYLGEHYDARLEQDGWNTLKPDKKNWTRAAEVPGPAGRLSVQMQPPIKITNIVKPVRIAQISS
ncbi:MAG: alpha-L-rhamnosidase N-terminal domain-containing protein [Cyclobacteriaceae bacterium]